MANIFLLAIRPLRPRHHRVTSALAKLANIAAVSRRWRTIVDAAPELWSFLHSSDPIKITRMALEKSKDASLTVTCIQYRYPKPEKDVVATRFIDCVKPHVPRWQFAFFRVSSTALKRIPGAAAPRLRSFTVECQDEDYLLNNPFGGQAPQLQELACLRAALGWHPAPLLAGLSSLKIVLPHKKRLFIRCSELYAAISNCPKLQSLTITQKAHRADDPHILANVPILHLPYLTEIRLILPPAFTNSILAHIQAPACNIFRAEAEVESADLLSRLLPYFSTIIRNRPLESWKTELYVGEESMGFTIYPARKRFTVWRPFDLEILGEWIPVFSWIIEKLLPPVAPQHPMRLHFSESANFESWLVERVFLRLPLVQHLVLEDTTNPELLWGWLANPIKNDTGESQWVFPELRKIEIYGGNYDWDLLVETARSRWGRDEDENPHRPQPLETLRFIRGDLTEKHLRDLEEVLGSETVTTEYSSTEIDSAESDWAAELL
ncbi:hypothetical protein FS837_009326 [Tulasnella sp. UAMH 9824]|nr:hypothetical protein FS837_009326 [Tulasnella sp. UAMH 9824]